MESVQKMYNMESVQKMDNMESVQKRREERGERRKREKRKWHRLNVVIYKAFGLDVAQGHMKGAPNENQTTWTEYRGKKDDMRNLKNDIKKKQKGENDIKRSQERRWK